MENSVKEIEHLGMRFLDFSQGRIKDFTEKEGIHPSKKEQVADMIRMIRELADNYAFHIDNIMTSDEEVREHMNLKYQVDRTHKLELINLITNF